MGECSRKEGSDDHVQGDAGVETAADGCLEKLLSVERECVRPEILGQAPISLFLRWGMRVIRACLTFN
jgi:hypothetical protein